MGTVFVVWGLLKFTCLLFALMWKSGSSYATSVKCNRNYRDAVVSPFYMGQIYLRIWIVQRCSFSEAAPFCNGGRLPNGWRGQTFLRLHTFHSIFCFFKLFIAPLQVLFLMLPWFKRRVVGVSWYAPKQCHFKCFHFDTFICSLLMFHNMQKKRQHFHHFKCTEYRENTTEGCDSCLAFTSFILAFTSLTHRATSGKAFAFTNFY